MIALILTAVISYTILGLITWFTIGDDFYYYKSKYNMLSELEYKVVSVGSDYHIKGYDKDGDERFLWFYPDNTFKIGPWNYLHNAAFTFCNPYSHYWYIKYKKYTTEVILPTLDLKPLKEY